MLRGGIQHVRVVVRAMALLQLSAGQTAVPYTPQHGSWLNQAEIEISMFSRGCLGTKRIPARSSLKRESLAWNRQMNRARVKIGRGFTRKAARKKFGYKKNYFIRSKT